MTIAAIITEGVGPGGTVPFLLTGGLGIGKAPIVVLDGHDPGEKKRRKKAAENERKRLEHDRDERERRRNQVIKAFGRIVEGKVEVSEPVADEIVSSIEASAPEISGPDFTAILNNLNKLEALWNEHLERDDEEVLALL